MPGTENFNDGASLAAKSWTIVSDAANTAAVGPDGSFALKNSALFGQGRMPLAPCAQSARFMVTFDWKRDGTTNENAAFHLLQTGSPSAGWGGTGDEWLVKLVEYGGGAGQMFTQGDGGVNVWSVPNMFPSSTGVWKTVRFEFVFSTGFRTGTDGAVLFGPYPGVRDEAGAVPSPTLDGIIRVWWGDDIASLVLRVEVTNIGVPNPHVWDAPTATPYDKLLFMPDGVIDNVVWNDFCNTVVDDSNICSCTGLNPDTAAAGGGTGAGASPVQYPSIGAQIMCVGGGLVPTQADLVYAETWWGN